MAQLAKYVFVRDERGRRHTFGPDDEVPSWAVSKITNPSAWGERAPDAPDPVAPAPAKKRRSPKKTVKPAEGTVQDEPETAQELADRKADEADERAAGDGVGTAGTE